MTFQESSYFLQDFPHLTNLNIINKGESNLSNYSRYKTDAGCRRALALATFSTVIFAKKITKRALAIIEALESKISPLLMFYINHRSFCFITLLFFVKNIIEFNSFDRNSDFS